MRHKKETGHEESNINYNDTAILLTSSVSAFAESPVSPIDINEASNLVALYRSTASYSARQANGQFTIGQAIPVFELAGTQLVSFPQVKYYPVYNGESVYGIYTVNTVGGGQPTLSFSSEFASILNQFILDGDSRFSVVYDSPATYIKSETQTALFLKSMGYRLDGQAVGHVDRTNIINNIPLPSNTNRKSTRTALNVEAQPYATRHTLPLDVWNQHNDSTTTKLCWAGTIWTIGSYLSGDDSYTPKSIATQLGYGNTGVDPKYFPPYYDEIYGITATYEANSGVLSPQEIADYIDSGTPIHGSWKGDGYGHSMAILGYQDDGLQICVMDSNIGDWKWMKNPSQDYKYTYGSSTATWTHSLTF